MGDFIVTGYDSETFAPIEMTLPELSTSTNRQVLHFGGRAYIRNGLWYGPNNTFGPSYPNYQQNFGKDNEPAINWYSRGFAVQKGEKLSQVVMTGRTNGTNVGSIDFRLYHLTGPFGGTFDSNGESTISHVASLTIPGGVNDRLWVVLEDLGAEMPADGFLIPMFRGVNVTSNRVFYFDGRLVFE